MADNLKRLASFEYILQHQEYLALGDEVCATLSFEDYYTLKYGSWPKEWDEDPLKCTGKNVNVLKEENNDTKGRVEKGKQKDCPNMFPDIPVEEHVNVEPNENSIILMPLVWEVVYEPHVKVEHEEHSDL